MKIHEYIVSVPTEKNLRKCFDIKQSCHYSTNRAHPDLCMNRGEIFFGVNILQKLIVINHHIQDQGTVMIEHIIQLEVW